MKLRNKQSGFTAIELTIALVVIALGLAAVGIFGAVALRVSVDQHRGFPAPVHDAKTGRIPHEFGGYQRRKYGDGDYDQRGLTRRCLGHNHFAQARRHSDGSTGQFGGYQ